jgi:hypothetical protein
MTIWRVHAGYIRQQIHTHSGCVIHIAFPLQQRLHERVSMLRYTYTARLVKIKCLALPNNFYYKCTPNLHRRSASPELRMNQLPPWQKWQSVYSGTSVNFHCTTEPHPLRRQTSVTAETASNRLSTVSISLNVIQRLVLVTGHSGAWIEMCVTWMDFGITRTRRWINSIDVNTAKLKLNSVALVRERTIPTERPPLVGEVSANFCG